MVHNTAFSTAKAADKTHMTRLFHGAEKASFGDSAYGAQADKRGARHEGLYYGIADRGAYQHPLSSSQKNEIASIRACEPRYSIRFVPSKNCGVIENCATKGWQKMGANLRFCARCPICIGAVPDNT